MKREQCSVETSGPQSETLSPSSKKVKSKSSSPVKGESESANPSTMEVKLTTVDQPHSWNADGREALMQHRIAEGLKTCDKAQLAEKFGVTKSKIHNELSLGRHGNMRDRAVKAARGN